MNIFQRICLAMILLLIVCNLLIIADVGSTNTIAQIILTVFLILGFISGDK